MEEHPPDKKVIHEEEKRDETLRQFKEWTDFPMLLLGLAWLVLLVIELLRGLTPMLELATTLVWVLFIVQFILEFALAPRKGRYLRQNWLTVISLFVPALRLARITRMARVFQVTRTARGLRLAKVVGSLNRVMKGLRGYFRQRRVGYVITMSIIVTFVGAAGMLAFERNTQGGQGFQSYGDALWWTAMIMTTLGSEFWPKTMEGRLLGFFLSLYAFAVFGYVTASLAGFFIGRDAAEQSTANTESLESLRREIRALQDSLRKEASRRPEP